MTWDYSITLRSLLAVAILEPTGTFAADDDIVATDTAKIKNTRTLRQQNGRRIIVLANGAAVQIGQFDQLVFGMDADRGHNRIDALIGQKIRSLTTIYVLSDEQLNKLKLAVRADRVRFDGEVDQLRRKYDAAGENVDELLSISKEASSLRRKQQDLIGSGSFFAKAAKKVLADATLKQQRYPSNYDDKGNSQEVATRRHNSNIESAIGAINRRVGLRNPQKQALSALLMKETRPAKVFGDFDDVVVKYRLSQLPEDKLKPLFDEDQWPRVRLVLDEFIEFRPSLIRRGLIAERQPKTEIAQELAHINPPADAIRPDNGGEKR